MENFLDELELDKNSCLGKIAIFLDRTRIDDYHLYRELLNAMGTLVRSDSTTDKIKEQLFKHGLNEFCGYVDADSEEFKRAWRYAVQLTLIRSGGLQDSNN